MADSSRRRDRFYDLAFAFVDAFACLDVAAALVIHAHVSEGLGIPEAFSGAVLTAYLYPLFGTLGLILLLDGPVRRLLSPPTLLLAGLALFAAGGGLCALAPGPLPFLLGRLIAGVGAALSFAGQLWSASALFGGRIARVLVWGEMGAALGDMAGPLLGALFARVSPGGWRGFFLLDGAVGLLALGLALRGLRGRPLPEPEGAAPGGALPGASGGPGLGVPVTWQVAVSLLLVGSQYLFSDYLQQTLDEGPLRVGAMNLLVSVGSVLGEFRASRLEGVGTGDDVPFRCVLGLLLCLAGLAACLSGGFLLLAGLPLLGVGLFSGMACVSVYASAVGSSGPERFLRCALLTLLGMQAGNALGVQAVGIGEWLRLGVPASAGVLAALPGAIVLGLRLPGRGAIRTRGRAE